MTWEDAAKIAGEMTSLKFFPTDREGRVAVMKIIAAMAADEQQVRWLVQRILTLFDEWPGPRTLRIVFCNRYKPADGIDIRGICKEYPDGIPPEKPIAAPSLSKLPAGRSFTADPQLDMTVRKLIAMPRTFDSLPPLPPAEEKRIQAFSRELEYIVTAPEDRPPEIKRKPIRQSEIISAHAEPDPVDAPRPEGTYQRITRENFDALLAEERKKKGES